MADLGLLAGLAQGIQQGIGTYTNTKQNLDEQALKKRMAQAQMMSEGFQQNPDTQELEYTPEKQNEIKLKSTQTQRTLDSDTPGTEAWNQGHQLAKGLLRSANPKLTDKDLSWVDSTPNSMLHGEQGLVKPVITGQFGVREAQLRADALTNAAGTRVAAKSDKETDKSFTDFSNSLDPNKGRAGNLAQLQASLNRADRVKALAANTHNLDARQQEELAISLQSLLSGSNSPAVSQVAALVPKTAMGDSQKLKEWLFNSPQGLNNQAFVDRMLDTVDREQGVISNQLKTAQYQKVSGFSHLRNKDPDRFSQVLTGYGLSPDEFDSFMGSRKSGGPGLINGAGGGQQQGAPASQDQYPVGTMAKDKSGKPVRYLGNGQWEHI